MTDSWRPTSARSSGSSPLKPPEQAELVAEPDQEDEVRYTGPGVVGAGIAGSRSTKGDAL